MAFSNGRFEANYARSYADGVSRLEPFTNANRRSDFSDAFLGALDANQEAGLELGQQGLESYAKRRLAVERAKAAQEAAEKEKRGGIFGAIGSAVLGTLGTVVGGPALGAVGAKIGGSAGKLFG